MTTPTTPGRRRRLGKGFVAVLATGLLLTACGDDGGGDGGGIGGGGGPTMTMAEPSQKSFEEAKEATIGTWDACEMFADHVRELAEFLDYKKFDDELFSTNGSNTAGVKLCEGRAIFYEDAEREIENAEGLIDIGFGTANMEGHLYHEEKYKTPTGRYDLKLDLMRDFYEADSLAERTEDGPWEEATVLLGDTGTGTYLSAYILDTERDFMIEMSLGGVRMEYDAEHLTWTWEKAAKHFREVTMVNAYQAMVDRYDAANE